jgi:murein DD-endopeptidase MepM/ murein hydrolase activator NlpD
MAMIPDSFVPSTTQSPLGVNPVSAQPVQAMRNYAPEQEQQMGAATQRLGNEVNDIGERIQFQYDDAATKQAETQFLQKAMVIANGDGDKNPGYLHTLGQDAINSLPDAQAALAKAKQEGLDSLTSDFQKRMYSRVAAQHLISFGAQFADHHFQQGQQFYTDASVNRANTYATSAANAYSTYGQTDADGNPVGDFFKNQQVAEQETLAAVQRSKGAPAGSDVANAALLNLHTQIGVGALTQMMDSRAPYSKVLQVYDDMKAKGMLDMRAMDSLGKMVKTYSEQEMTRTAVTRNLSDAVRASQGQPTSSTGTPDYQFPIKGATTTAQPYDEEEGNVAVTIPAGSSVQAPADGKVTSVGRDDDGNFSMKIQHADGSVTGFTGLSASNVKVGDSVQRGEDVATSGAVNGGKVPAVLWSLTSKDGQVVDPTRAGLAPVDLTKVTDENVLGNALDSLRKQITDPYLQQQATSEMESIVRHNQQMQNAAESQVYKQASAAFYSNWNVRDIPPSVAGQLTPEQLAKFKDEQTGHVLQQYHQGQAFKEMNETDILAGFAQDPTTLTPENVEAAHSRLANSSYLSLMEKATAMQNNPKGVQEAQAVSERVKYFAEQAGLNISGTVKRPDGTVAAAKPTPADKQDFTALQFQVDEGINQIKSQNHGKATQKQVDDLIQGLLVKRAFTQPTMHWYDPLSWVGVDHPMDSTQKYQFQMPSGATHVAPGSDGKLHYTDGKNDLGVVQ